MQEMLVRSLGQEDPLEKEMATHSSILAWETPGTGEPGRLRGCKESDTTERLDSRREGSGVLAWLSHTELQGAVGNAAPITPGHRGF